MVFSQHLLFQRHYICLECSDDPNWCHDPFCSSDMKKFKFHLNETNHMEGTKILKRKKWKLSWKLQQRERDQFIDSVTRFVLYGDVEEALLTKEEAFVKKDELQRMYDPKMLIAYKTEVLKRITTVLNLANFVDKFRHGWVEMMREQGDFPTGRIALRMI